MSLLHNSKHKLKNIYRVIDRLIDSDFPLEAGRKALQKLRETFLELETRLDRAHRAKSPDTIATLANNINLKIFQVLPILGFILRSTNVRNAFEVLDPLQFIASAALQGNPQLIFSSEWDYVPFAYPQSLEDLKSFVLIGMPASEAASALLMPLAGHELGHAVWRNRGFDGGVVATLQAHCEELYEQNIDRFRQIFSDYKSSDIVGRQVLPDAIADSVEYAVRQGEELFCDLFAYAIFGRSYLFAFSYILAPGSGGVRDPNYPQYGTRIEVIRKVAAEEKTDDLPAPADLNFSAESRRGDARHRFMVEMAERSVDRIINGIGRLSQQLSKRQEYSAQARRQPNVT
jgi:hypothetical protein